MKICKKRKKKTFEVEWFLNKYNNNKNSNYTSPCKKSDFTRCSTVLIQILLGDKCIFLEINYDP